MPASHKAVFLDRDGTLIADVEYPRDPAQVQLLPGVGPALADLKRRGFLLVLVSNQSGIGRGLITREEAERVHCRMVELLALQGVCLDACYYCPHRPEDGCHCRKPGAEHFIRAAAEWNIDLAKSFMIGDKQCDAEAGRNAGCCSILFGSASDQVRPDVDVYIAMDWSDAVTRIIGQR